MKRLILLLLTVCMSSLAFSEEHVVTIYFGGTGLTENGWTQGDTATGFGNTRWDTPSLMAELHHYHDASASTQHKIFIPGVGAKQTPTDSGWPLNHCAGNPKHFPVDPWHAFLQQAVSNANICRNWKQTVAEALMGLQAILDGLSDEDKVILNVLGHSRGAIAAFWFMERGFSSELVDPDDPSLPHVGVLDEETDSGRLTKVNLITLEPVPGIDLIKGVYKDIVEYKEYPPIWTESEVLNAVPGFTATWTDIEDFLSTYVTEDPYGTKPMGWDVFRLDSRVNKFVAIYADDERGKKFGAVVPYLDNIPDSNTLMFRVRGSHQTMVGSLWKYGHAPLGFPLLCPWPYDFDDDSGAGLEALFDLIETTVSGLIGDIDFLGVLDLLDYINGLLGSPIPDIPPASWFDEVKKAVGPLVNDYGGAACEGAKHNTDLIVVRNTVAITVMELLAGLEWGGVEFENEDFLKGVYDPDGYYDPTSWGEDIPAREDSFDDHVNVMSVLADVGDFEWMKMSHFFPSLWPVSVKVTNPVDILAGLNGVPNIKELAKKWAEKRNIPTVVPSWIVLKNKDRPAGPIAEFDGVCVNPSFEYPGDPTTLYGARSWLLSVANPRCMVRVLKKDAILPDHEVDGLSYMNDVPLLGDSGSTWITATDAWERIRVLANGDGDVDGITNDLDFCPDTDEFDRPIDADGCSDAQVDGDGDGICDPGAPNGGPSGCTGSDNCPNVANLGQENFDGDGLGDVCDTDIDDDDVANADDVCPWTEIPESVPTVSLKPNHWALVTPDDAAFDTLSKGRGKGPGLSYSTTDTAGCSCEQIIAIQGLGRGYTKHGCDISAMEEFVEFVSP